MNLNSGEQFRQRLEPAQRATPPSTTYRIEGHQPQRQISKLTIDSHHHLQHTNAAQVQRSTVRQLINPYDPRSSSHQRTQHPNTSQVSRSCDRQPMQWCEQPQNITPFQRATAAGLPDSRSTPQIGPHMANRLAMAQKSDNMQMTMNRNQPRQDILNNHSSTSAHQQYKALRDVPMTAIGAQLRQGTP